MRFVKAGIQKYIDLINEFAQKEGDEFNRSVYHQHIGDLNQAIKRIEDYDPYMDTPASIEDEAERLYPYEVDEGNIAYTEDELKDLNAVRDTQRSAHITCARQYTDTIEKLRAENERYRKALETIAEKYADAEVLDDIGQFVFEMGEIATSALK